MKNLDGKIMKKDGLFKNKFRVLSVNIDLSIVIPLHNEAMRVAQMLKTVITVSNFFPRFVYRLVF
jgi:hypothetical protein